MLITYGSSRVKAPDSFTLIIMSTLSDYQGVSQTENETLGLPYGSSNLQDKRGFGSVPQKNITFQLQISYIQCYYHGYLWVLILIFLIPPRLFLSRDYNIFLLNDNHNSN